MNGVGYSNYTKFLIFYQNWRHVWGHYPALTTIFVPLLPVNVVASRSPVCQQRQTVVVPSTYIFGWHKVIISLYLMGIEYLILPSGLYHVYICQ